MVKFNTPHAHSSLWQHLDNITTVNLLKEAFGDSVKILPSQSIIEELRRLGVATLELLENRTGSTVYRIRQTGVVYQIEAIIGEIFEYDDYDSYVADDAIDKLVASYSTGEMPTYTVARVDAETLFITRNNPPCFCCTYKNVETQFTKITDPIEPIKAAKIMRSMGVAVIKFLQDEQRAKL